MKYSQAYSTFLISEKLDIPRSSLQLYIDKGYIKPSIERATGKGTKSLFTLEDIYHLKLFQIISRRGFSQKIASDKGKYILETYHDLLEDDLGWVVMIEENGEIQIDSTYVQSGFDIFYDNWELDNAIIINLCKMKDKIDKIVK